MDLVVNGEARSIQTHAGSLTVAELVASLGMPRERVAVEVNGALVVRADHALHAMKSGDVVEIVTLVGGG